MRATLPSLLLVLVLLPGAGAAQKTGGTGLGPEQWWHWALKASAGAATFEALHELEVAPDLSAVIATTAPTVVGKILYAPKGLGDDPHERWPDAGFVAKDIAGELCVQSAPLWLRFAMSGPKDQRLARGLLAVGGYGLAVFGCARPLEVR